MKTLLLSLCYSYFNCCGILILLILVTMPQEIKGSEKPYLSTAQSPLSNVGKPNIRIFVVTAYCPCKICCSKWSGGQTASGKMPTEGITCAASRRFPFGTRLKIEDVGTRIVQDRLAARYDSRIDIFFNDHKKALVFGKRTLNVEVGLCSKQ